jgi:pyruvate formate lyase activating enzyme
MLTGLVSNIQRYSVQDGPGIRTTVFLQGCPLDCWWCHNSEARSLTPQILVLEGRCLRCGACVHVCPRAHASPGLADAAPGALASPPEPARSQCRLCGACVETCPTGARQRVGRTMTVDDVLAAIGEDTIFYDDSGGGVTFSGGEPLVQAEFLQAALAACRARGIHTALDTCGFAPRDKLLAAASQAQLVLYDLKFMDDARHRRYTGVSNRLILENLQALSRTRAQLWIRVPVIPGLNDAPTELDAMARFVAALGGVRQVNLLPYHRTGIQKQQRLGERARLGDTTPPMPERMEAAAEHFRAFGLRTKVGG